MLSEELYDFLSNELYEYLMENSPYFKNLSMDMQGELIVYLVKKIMKKRLDIKS